MSVSTGNNVSTARSGVPPRTRTPHDDESRHHREEKLDRLVQNTDAVASVVSGPVRVVLGATQLAHADSKKKAVSGVHNILTGVTSAVYGTLQALGQVANISTLIGLAPIATVATAAGAALGGVILLGWAGFAAAELKGGRDIYTGIKHHDKLTVAAGSGKLVAGGLMAAGAASINPGLTALGGFVYLGCAIVAGRHQIADIAHRVLRKVGIGHADEEAKPIEAAAAQPQSPSQPL